MVQSLQPHQQVSARSSHTTNHPPQPEGDPAGRVVFCLGRCEWHLKAPSLRKRIPDECAGWRTPTYVWWRETHTKEGGGRLGRVTARLVSGPCAYFDLSVKDSPKRHCSAPSLIRCLGKNRVQSITHEWAQSHNTILIFPPIHMAKKRNVLQCKHWQQQYETNVLISRFCNPAHSRDCWWWLLYSQSEVKQNKYHVT